MQHITSVLVLILSFTKSHYNSLRRDLYDIGRYQSNNRLVNVTTAYHGLMYPMGATLGTYNNVNGLFVSTFVTNNIYFMDTSHHNCINQKCSVVQVAGTGNAGTSDGTFLTASFTCPSRMLYLKSEGLLLVTDRANGYIRMLNFQSSSVKTMLAPKYYNRYSKADGYKISRLRVSGSQLASDNPEIDIKTYGNYIYVSDAGSVYNITGSDGTLKSLYNCSQITAYTSLSKWQSIYQYDKIYSKVFITSIAISGEDNLMYIALSYQRNAIIVMPLDCGNYNDIQIIVSDGLIWDKIPIVYPIPKNGYIGNRVNNATVTFPMSLQYSKKENTLYWTEVYASSAQGTKNGALGAVAVRRLVLGTGMVDYYAGNVGSFRAYLGKVTGFADGDADGAQFSYPVTLVSDDSLISPNGGPLLYVVDYQNQAIRVVYSYHDSFEPTTSPTAEPTISFHPTLSPTVEPSTPTVEPTQIPVMSPGSTYSPTSIPAVVTGFAVSRSASPTVSKFDECLKISLFDTFGDGWSGAMLHVTLTQTDSDGRHRRTVKSVDDFSYPEPCSLDSAIAVLCASRRESDDEFGLYTLEIQHTENTPNIWEVYWRVEGAHDHRVHTGEYKTQMTFRFNANGFLLVHSDHLMPSSSRCDVCPALQLSGVNGTLSSSESVQGRSRSRHIGGLNFVQSNIPNADVRHIIPKLNIVRSDRSSSADNEVYEFPIRLLDRSGLGWYGGDDFGTWYYVSSANRTRLVTKGTLCEGQYSTSCAVSLPNGQYYVRVGSASNSTKEGLSWEFCGVTSDTYEELSFTISEGKCVSGMVKSVQTSCQQSAKTVIVLEGQIVLTNVLNEHFSLADQKTIEQAIASVLNMPHASRAAILETCVTQAGEFCSQYYNEQQTAVLDTGLDAMVSSNVSHYGGDFLGIAYEQSRRLLSAYSYSLSRHLPEFQSRLRTVLNSVLSGLVLYSAVPSSLRGSSEGVTAERSSANVPTHRVLKSKQDVYHGVKFAVSLVTEDYGVDGTLYYDILDFTNATTELASSAVRNGVLESEIRSLATMTNTPGLMYAVVDDVITLTLTSISYVSTLPPTPMPSQSPVPQNYILVPGDTKSSEVQSESNTDAHSFVLYREMIMMGVPVAVLLLVVLLVVGVRLRLQKPVDRFDVSKGNRRISELLTWNVDMDNSGTNIRRMHNMSPDADRLLVRPDASLFARSGSSHDMATGSKSSRQSRTKKDDFLVMATVRPDLSASPRPRRL